MKAKELIKLLEQYPDAEVVFAQYNGGCTPLVEVTEIEFHKQDTYVPYQSDEGGEWVNKRGELRADVIILNS